MNKQMIRRFKQIYELERFLIAFCMSQLSSTEDKFYCFAFSRMVETEKEHAKFFAQKLAEKDISVPRLGANLAGAAGSIIGETMEFSGRSITCKTGVILGKKLIAAYQELLQVIKEFPQDTELGEKVLLFLLEEEFHTLWLKNYAKRLDQMELCKSGLGDDVVSDHPTINVNMRWL